MINYYEHVIVVTKVLKVTTGNAFIYLCIKTIIRLKICVGV